MPPETIDRRINFCHALGVQSYLTQPKPITEGHMIFSSEKEVSEGKSPRAQN